MGTTTALERFTAKNIVNEDGCWEWQGARENGYGRMSDDTGKRVPVHIWVWEHFVGPRPLGLVPDHICHVAPCTGGVLCRHRRCSNPEHIQWVTRAENAARSSRTWQTKCRKGHDFTPENTRFIDGGRRQCVTCQNDRAKKSWRRAHPDAVPREFYI